MSRYFQNTVDINDNGLIFKLGGVAISCQLIPLSSTRLVLVLRGQAQRIIITSIIEGKNMNSVQIVFVLYICSPQRLPSLFLKLRLLRLGGPFGMLVTTLYLGGKRLSHIVQISIAEEMCKVGIHNNEVAKSMVCKKQTRSNMLACKKRFNIDTY